MRGVVSALTTEVALTAALVAGHALGATVAVDVNTHYQTIDGFGASTAWGSSMSATDADLLWDTTTGAGLSLHRIHISGGTTSETNIAKLAVAHGVKVWAAPWEVKAADVTGSPPTLTNPQDWANTLVSFLTTMKNAGVPIYALSAENEPDSKGANNTTSYTADQMATWVGSYLGPALAGTDTKLMAPETENWYGIGSYLTSLQNNADAWKYTSIVATHEYGGSPAAYPQIAQAGKRFWETEIYDTDNNEDPGMGSALRVANLIHQALTIANMNAWHFWWVYPCCNDNGALWDKNTNQPSKRLWVMGNYSRFVRPGYVRIGATAAPATGITISAYYGAQADHVVIVAANTNTSATSQAFTISNASALKVTPWVTDATRNLVADASLTPTGNSFTYSLPAQSVTTLVVNVDSTSSAVKNAEAGGLSTAKVSVSGSALQIQFTARASGPISARLFNLKGRLVQAIHIQTRSGETYTQRFDLVNQPEGLYLLKISHAGRVTNSAKILYLAHNAALLD